MIGSGLKKLAASHDMRIDKGVAYGDLYGYAATLSEGSGYKLIQITTTFWDPQQQFQLQTLLNGRDLMKEFRVQEITFSETRIIIQFYDNLGTMKKLTAFIEWFFPLLNTYGATGVNVCTQCGCELTTGKWVLIDNAAYHFHETCANTVKASLVQESDRRKQEDTGSYISGIVGAFLGAALGSVLWALILMLGYVASVVGFVIGWLAEKGYSLLHGKNGKGKIVILIFAVIFGVLFGTVLGEAFTLFSMIGNGELYDFTYADIPLLIAWILLDAEYISSVLGNMVVGLLFAGLGIFSLLRRTNREVSDTKVIDLH